MTEDVLMKISTDVLFAVFIGITLIVMFWALKPRRKYKRLLEASENKAERDMFKILEVQSALDKSVYRELELQEKNKLLELERNQYKETSQRIVTKDAHIQTLHPMDKAQHVIDDKSLMNGAETPAYYNDVPITPNEYAEMVLKTIKGLTPYQFLLLGNIIKYVPRIGKKDDVLSTLKKIAHYANELVAKEEEKSKTP